MWSCAKYRALGGGHGRGLRCFWSRDSYRKPLYYFAISVKVNSKDARAALASFEPTFTVIAKEESDFRYESRDEKQDITIRTISLIILDPSSYIGIPSILILCYYESRRSGVFHPLLLTFKKDHFVCVLWAQRYAGSELCCKYFRILDTQDANYF